MPNAASSTRVKLSFNMGTGDPSGISSSFGEALRVTPLKSASSLATTRYLKE
jgi:hypothetical protein